MTTKDEATIPKAGIDAAITTEHDLQHEYDKYNRAEMMQSYGASERQIETMLKESNEMNTYRASTPRLEPAVAQKAPDAAVPCRSAELMDGKLVKGRSGWQVETCFPLPDGRELSFSTSKRHDGSLCTTASVSKRDGLGRTFVVFQDYMKTIRREKVRCTAKTVQAQHLDALKDKDIVMAEVKAQYYPEGEAS